MAEAVAAPLAAALAALAAVGLLDALYFVGVTYRWFRPDAPWVPRVCRMDPGTCARVVDTPEARVLGPPNSVLGAAWYVAVLGAAAWALAGHALPPGLGLALLAASGLTVALSAYLAWALLARLRVRCTLCFLGHAVNAAILAVLLAAWLPAWLPPGSGAGLAGLMGLAGLTP